MSVSWSHIAHDYHSYHTYDIRDHSWASVGLCWAFLATSHHMTLAWRHWGETYRNLNRWHRQTSQTTRPSAADHGPGLTGLRRPKGGPPRPGVGGRSAVHHGPGLTGLRRPKGGRKAVQKGCCPIYTGILSSGILSPGICSAGILSYNRGTQVPGNTQSAMRLGPPHQKTGTQGASLHTAV